MGILCAPAQLTRHHRVNQFLIADAFRLGDVRQRLARGARVVDLLPRHAEQLGDRIRTCDVGSLSPNPLSLYHPRVRK